MKYIFGVVVFLLMFTFVFSIFKNFFKEANRMILKEVKKSGFKNYRQYEKVKKVEEIKTIEKTRKKRKWRKYQKKLRKIKKQQ